MHFYWRIIEELKFIGETWVITDPSLKRNYERWLRVNAKAIALITMGAHIEGLRKFYLKNDPFYLN